MDGKPQREKVKNPREGINVFSAVTFFWILRTFLLGHRRNLEVSDLYSPLKEHTSSILGDKVASVWEDEVQRAKRENSKNRKNDSKVKVVEPSMLRVLVKCFGARIMINGIALAIMELVFRMMQPVFLSYFLRYYSSNGTEVSEREAYLYAGGVIMCSAVNIFVIHPYMMACFHIGMKMRIACCTLIYRKALRLSKTALGKTTVGQMVNLLSNDVSRFDMSILFLHYLWVGPLEVAVVSYFMYTEVGISAIIGIASLLMFIPFQGFLGKRSSILRMKTAIKTDERVRLTNEIINGIQAIKMYAWEKPFSALVEAARRREINVLRSMSYIRGIVISFTIFATRFSIFVTLLSYVLFKEHVTAQKVFMLTAYYNILRQTMTIFLPQGISQLAEVSVSVKRLQKFMMYEEVIALDKVDSKENGEKPREKKNDKSEKTESSELINKGCVILENGFAKWVASEEEDTLRNINIKVNPGQLIAIVGHVGSGKTSVLNIILRELPLHTGTVQINGSIAYASQEPWLFTGSVKQNILFGQKMDQRRYERVIKVCQLKRDFTLLPYGDKTIVGERGISLSGGQRARINLARAVYANADIYLLDDPLSAVDTHVGKHMFDECISGYLKGKARILVTHQLQHLRNVDRIIVLKDGIIQTEGTYDELRAMGVDFGRLLNSQIETDDPSSAPASRSSSRHASFTSLNSFITNEAEPTEIEEKRTLGKVSGTVYSAYARAGGNWCVTFGVLMLCIMAQLAASAGDSFTATWVNMEERFVTVINGTTKIEWLSPLSREACIYLYSTLTILTVLLTIVRSSSFFSSCMRASKRLHDKMFNCISRATMYFFNVNNSGRILNRFSKDMGAIDELLPTALLDCLQLGLSLLGIIVVVGVVNPWLLVPTIILGIISYYLRVFYLSTSRSIKRLEGITRSPVFAHLNATLQGLTTIRAFDAGELLTEEFDHHQDLHSSAWFIFLASSRAFGLWLDVICLVYITLVTLSFLILPMGGEETTYGGNVGLAITQSIGLTGMLQWGLRQSAELENQMTSVERVLEYSNLELEPSLESAPEKKPRDDWPQEGKVKFEGVSMRYSLSEPPVLKNLSFTINSREKVGIVGRTGAGKSSLISALFRLADVDGLIEIDGVDTSQIGLHDLRSKLSVIPQEPFLFSGSLRHNLDPFDAYSDNVLWQALEEVELKEFGLESRVADGGMNLSVGQRQLVCLARAIVRNNPILILDEATANVDPHTDELIQITIRRKFENCTVLTIAHRLNTVMDNDRILVMDAGTVVEFDHPHVLVQKEGGYLRNMVRQTGKAMADALNTVAYDSYLQSASSVL